MDLLDSILGQQAVSRRTLIQGAIVGLSGTVGLAQTDREGVISLLKDDRNDDKESTSESAAVDDGSGGDATDPEGDGRGSDRAKEVISQVDLTERDGRVTIRLGAYERVVADLNRADGNSIGQSAWRVDGNRAARSGVSFRAREGNTLQITLQNPTPIPYSFSVRTDDGDGNRLRADGHGVTVYAGGVETVVLEKLAHGEYAYEVDTLTRPIEPLGGRLLVDT